MKLSLPIKLGITVIVIFGLLMLGMFLWKPMKVRYYAAKLRSDDIKVRQHAAKELLNLDREKVFNYYTDRYDPKDVKKRMGVVDELCACGDKGKAVMKEIFRNWCYSQQVKIPAGTLALANGSKVEIKSLWMDTYEVTIEKFAVYYLCTGGLESANKAVSKTILDVPFSSAAYPSRLYPVAHLSWQDAKAYTDWLGMRLPTIHEWEYAARAGSTGHYCFGNNKSLLGEYAWCKYNSDGILHPVGQKEPNKWGLHDVHGNAWEICVLIISGDAVMLKGDDINGDTHTSAFGCAHLPVPKSITPGRTVGFRCVRDIKYIMNCEF
ncbi:MAG: formylglycine-generating enzyme family protein [Planctomycetota bacterium]|nr:MAG: formylglycine-generating enzyme family protein [Planctomycetota bacterium]